MADVTKTVLMHLKLVPDPGNAAVAAQVAAQADKARGGVGGGSSGGADKESAADLAIQKSIVAVEKEMVKAEKDVEKARQSSIAASLKALAAEEAQASKIMANRIKLVARIQEEAAAKQAAATKDAADQAAAVAKTKQQADAKAAAEVAAAESANQRIALNRQKLLGKIAAADQAAAKQAEQTARVSAMRGQALSDKAFMAQQSASQAFTRAGHGLLSAGKGAVMAGMFTDNDQDLAKLVTNLAKVEIGFQALKGGLDIVTGLRQGMFMLTRATAAQAAAQGLMTAAGGAAASGVGGLAAGAAGGGLASGGVTAASTAAATGMGSMAAAAGAIALKFVAIPLVAAELIQGLRRGKDVFTRMEGPGESIISAMFSWRTAVNNAAKSTEALAKATETTGQQIKERRVLREDVAGKRGALLAEDQEGRRAAREQEIGATVGLGLGDKERGLSQQAAIRKAAESELEAAKKAAAAAKIVADERSANDRGLAAKNVKIAEEAVTAQQEKDRPKIAGVGDMFGGVKMLWRKATGGDEGKVAGTESEAMKKANAELIAAKQEQAKLDGQAFTSHEDLIGATKRLESAQRAVGEAAKKTLDITRSEIQAALELKKAAEETKGDERAAYGKLNSTQQQNVKDIAAHLEGGGTLNDAMKATIESMGAGAELLFKGQLDKQERESGEADPILKQIASIGSKKEAEADLKLRTNIADEANAAQQVAESGRAAETERGAGVGLKAEQQGIRNPIAELGETGATAIHDATEQSLVAFNKMLAGYVDAMKKLEETFDRHNVKQAQAGRGQ